MVNARLSNDGSFEQAEVLSDSYDLDVIESRSNLATEQFRHHRMMASYISQVRGFNAAWESSTQWQAQANARAGTFVDSHDPPPYTRPQPSQPQHRVYTLHCSHCDSFVSDRGMRAVLLLRPHITLFSTDAPPSNCGALYSNTDEEPLPDFENVERTCECLTQSLGCFGCGTTIGYQIIVPCTRCIGSVARNSQRASNGHRYVFHHNEVTFAERRYRHGEPGVLKEYVYTGNLSDQESSSASSSPIPERIVAQADTKDGHASSLRSFTAGSGIARATSHNPANQHYLRDGSTLYWHHLAPAGELRCSLDARVSSLTVRYVGR